MVKATVIPNPAVSIEGHPPAGRDRCACCGGPTLPVLEWRGDHALCHRCARRCESKGGRWTHAVPTRIDWTAADRIWATDLGFKRLGQ